MNGILHKKIAKNRILMKIEARLFSFYRLSKIFGLRLFPYDYNASREKDMYEARQKNIAKRVEKYPFLFVFTSNYENIG